MNKLFFHQLCGWLLALLSATIFACLFQSASGVLAGKTIFWSHEFLSSLGLSLSFKLDALSLFFCLIITGIGALVFQYLTQYLSVKEAVFRFYTILFLFMVSMLGLVLANDLISLFIFWELTGITSFFLIGFNHEEEKARKAALKALIITGLGGLFMLVGFVLMAGVAGSYYIPDLLKASDLLKANAHYVIFLPLILLGAFSKSAQFPFHSWLPGAMAAPTPASAYLHSATMVKAGVYLLLRFSPILGGTALWQETLVSAGILTVLVGSYNSFKSTDLKMLLAHSTVTSLGLMVVLIGLGSSLAIQACLLFIIAHALYKAGLFLQVGIYAKKFGSREINKLHGYRPSMVTISGVLLALAMAGFIPFFSFISKEIVYESFFKSPFASAPTYLFIVIVANAIMMMVAFLVGIRPFLRTSKNRKRKKATSSFLLCFSPLVLSLLGLYFGIKPKALSGFIDPMISDSAKLYLWHGLTPALFASAFTYLIGGFVIYKRNAFFQFFQACGDVCFKKTIAAFSQATSFVVSRVQYSSPSAQLYAVVFALVILIYPLLGSWGDGKIVISLSEIGGYQVTLVGLLITMAVVMVSSQSRFLIVAALGGIGVCIALMFMIFGAPDLALTQVMVEALSVIISLLMLKHLPLLRQQFRVMDAVVAIMFGVIVSSIVYEILKFPIDLMVSDFYLNNSYLKAYGRNVVNVILVDFRGFDTLGESLVVGIAALAGYNLLKVKPGKATL